MEAWREREKWLERDRTEKVWAAEMWGSRGFHIELAVTSAKTGGYIGWDINYSGIIS